VFWGDAGETSQKAEALMHSGDTDSRLPAIFFFEKLVFFQRADAPMHFFFGKALMERGGTDCSFCTSKYVFLY
jgi:hypothetical protein